MGVVENDIGIAEVFCPAVTVADVGAADSVMAMIETCVAFDADPI